MHKVLTYRGVHTHTEVCGCTYYVRLPVCPAGVTCAVAPPAAESIWRANTDAQSLLQPNVQVYIHIHKRVIILITLVTCVSSWGDLCCMESKHRHTRFYFKTHTFVQCTN